MPLRGALNVNSGKLFLGPFLRGRRNAPFARSLSVRASDLASFPLLLTRGDVGVRTAFAGGEIHEGAAVRGSGPMYCFHSASERLRPALRLARDSHDWGFTSQRMTVPS